MIFAGVIKAIRRLFKGTDIAAAPLHIDKIYHAKEYAYHKEQAVRHSKLALVFRNNVERKVHHEMQAIYHHQQMAKHNQGSLK